MHDVCNVVISIHAPTRGATGIVGIAIGVVKFQSTLPREERQLSLLYLQLPLKFQSTLPREERHGTRIFSTLIINFNPRSHERSDNSVNIIVRLRVISIHAPTRGATQSQRYQLQKNCYFNPRSHERSDKTFCCC